MSTSTEPFSGLKLKLYKEFVAIVRDPGFDVSDKGNFCAMIGFVIDSLAIPQRWIADETGIDKTAVSRWKSCESAPPVGYRRNILEHLAKEVEAKAAALEEHLKERKRQAAGVA